MAELVAYAHSILKYISVYCAMHQWKIS